LEFSREIELSGRGLCAHPAMLKVEAIALSQVGRAFGGVSGDPRHRRQTKTGHDRARGVIRSGIVLTRKKAAPNRCTSFDQSYNLHANPNLANTVKVTCANP
jgi:hypothetical protein